MLVRFFLSLRIDNIFIPLIPRFFFFFFFFFFSLRCDSVPVLIAEDDDQAPTGSKRSKRSIWEKELKRFAEAWDFKKLTFADEVADR